MIITWWICELTLSREAFAPSMALVAVLAAALASSGAALRLRGGWAEQQAYNDPAKPPAWVAAPQVLAPGVPGNMPPPVFPADYVPPDPYVLQSGPIFINSAPPPQKAPAGGVWPPAQPDGPIEYSPYMRPLTLLDAKGGEYSKNDPNIAVGKKK